MDNLASASDNLDRDVAQKSQAKAPMLTKSTITCECGAQILLVPDAKAMSKAIEAHVDEHMKKEKVSNAKAEAILDDLIAKVFCKATSQTKGL